MSWQALTWATEQKAKAVDKLVLIMLANRLNHDTGRCTPSIDRLANDCGMSRSGVKLSIKRLEAAGLLQIIERRVETQQLPNQYALPIHEKLPPRPRDDRPPGHDVTGKQGTSTSSSSTAVDTTSWPASPSPQVLHDWLKLRQRKHAPVTDTVVAQFAKKLEQAAAIGWTVDDVLVECCERGWASFKPEWLEPRNGKPQPVRAGAGTANHDRRDDYAHRSERRNPGARGSAIDRVLGNAFDRAAEAAAAAEDSRPDRRHDDLGLCTPMD